MNEQKKTNAGYFIRDRFRFDEFEIVLGEHQTQKDMYVTWECRMNRGKLPNYYWGHYFKSYPEAVIDYANRIKDKAQFILEVSKQNKELNDPGQFKKDTRKRMKERDELER